MKHYMLSSWAGKTPRPVPSMGHPSLDIYTGFLPTYVRLVRLPASPSPTKLTSTLRGPLTANSNNTTTAPCGKKTPCSCP